MTSSMAVISAVKPLHSSSKAKADAAAAKSKKTPFASSAGSILVPKQQQQPSPAASLHRRVKSLPGRTDEIHGKALFWFLSGGGNQKRPSFIQKAAAAPMKVDCSSLSTLTTQAAAGFASSGCLATPELAIPVSFDDDDEDDWSAYSEDEDTTTMGRGGDDSSCRVSVCSGSERDPLLGLTFMDEELTS